MTHDDRSSTTEHAGPGDPDRTPDAPSRLGQVGKAPQRSSPGTTTYAYDPDGNRLSKPDQTARSQGQLTTPHVARRRGVLLIVVGLAVVFVAVVVIQILLLTFGTDLGALGSDIGEGVTTNGILALRPGMSEAEVVRLIGGPIRDEQARADQDPDRRARVLTYARPNWFGGGFEVYVRLREGRLTSVHVESFDLGVYRCDEKECPTWYGPQDALTHLGHGSRRVRAAPSRTVDSSP